MLTGALEEHSLSLSPSCLALRLRQHLRDGEHFKMSFSQEKKENSRMDEKGKFSTVACDHLTVGKTLKTFKKTLIWFCFFCVVVAAATLNILNQFKP